jgi:ADP-ribosylation factor GTPase-activating protein 2/3
LESEWKWGELRKMKVGGNEAATKFFSQTPAGRAALNSKDPKTKYDTNTAEAYKKKVQQLAAADIALQ